MAIENQTAIASVNVWAIRYATDALRKTPKDIYTAVKTETAKACPKCPDTRLVVRTNKNTSHDFLGCGNWPECNYTEPLPLDMEMRRQGAPVLPGFE